MFTGIIEEIGKVRSVTSMGDKTCLIIQAQRVLEGIQHGDSININGVCQTVTAFDAETFTVDTLAVSLKKTTLGSLKTGNLVNLERALRADSRLGGHIVQGHITCTVRLTALQNMGNNVYLAVEIPNEQLRYCVAEGSITLDGVSLTIAELNGTTAVMNIIPATLKATTLGNKRAGDFLNLETDIIGRYVEKLLLPAAKTGGLTFERLKELGY